MKNRTTFLFGMMAAAMLAVSCGQNDPAQRPSSSSNESSPDSSQTSQGSEFSTEEATSPVLRIAFYEKFVTQAQSGEWTDAFRAHLAENSVDLVVETVSYTASGNGAAFGGEVKTYNDAHVDAKIDALMGARNNLGDYVTENYEAFPDGTTTYALGDQTNRIL